MKLDFDELPPLEEYRPAPDGGRVVLTEFGEAVFRLVTKYLMIDFKDVPGGRVPVLVRRPER